MKRLSFYSLSGLLLLIALPVSAASFQAGETVAVGTPGPTNVYAAGGTVSLSKSVPKDLVVAGGKVIISGNVGDDLLAAGGDVSMDGQVGSDARIAGGTVTVGGSTKGDMVVTGGNITIADTATASGDMIIAGGQVEILGRVHGNLRVYGGKVTMLGTIDGNADIHADTVSVVGRIGGNATIAANTITFDSNAKIGKDLHYYEDSGEQTSGLGMVGGKTNFDPTLARHTESATNGAASALATFGLFSLVSGGLLIVLFVLITKNFFAQTAAVLREQPWWTLFYGFVYLILTPVVAILLLVTIFALPLGIVLLLLYALSLYFVTPAAAVVLAKWLQEYYHKEWSKGMVILLSIGLLIALKFLVLIPVIGLLVKAVIWLMVLGALLVSKTEAWKKIL